MRNHYYIMKVTSSKSPTFAPRLIGAILMLFASVHCLFGQGTAFTYQGRLTDNGSLPNASYDMKFSVYDSANGGNQIGSTILQTSIPVNGGLFTTQPLDFGASIFTGPPRWLKIEISPAGANAFTPLSARQPLTAAPYAVRAGDAGTLAGQSPSTFAPASGSSAYVAKAGDIMTGNLLVYTNDHLNAGNIVLTASSTDGTAFYCQSYNQPFHAHNLFTGTDVQLAVGRAGSFTGDVTVSGNVGIGTAAPGYALDVNGTANSSFAQITAGSPTLSFYSPNQEIFQLKQEGTSLNGASKFSVIEDCCGVPRYLMSILYSGAVGIGTTNPVAKLQVVGNSSPGASIPQDIAVLASGDGFHNRIMSVNGNQSVYLSLFDSGSGYGELSTYDWSTGQGLPLKLNVNGGTVSVPVLEITGGSDVAEPFQMSCKDLPKGALVVIDDENAGQLKMSERPYDTHVAGIISGANGINPGIQLHQEGALEGGQNVALSGRVYALANASFGAIHAGDLLTTSATPGHCMKATDHARASGAIIGKAMSSLKDGEGMVLVLVTLQ